MQKVRRAGLLALGLLALAGLALALLYLGSAWRVRQLPNVPALVRVPTGGDAVEGSRLASVLGCRGCHGADLGGQEKCHEQPGASLTCPNVTAARERYEDRDLVILLRHGRKRDGALVDFMPWDMYAQLTDRDLAHVIAFVRSAPAARQAVTLPDSSYSWAVRWKMLLGDYPEQVNLAEYDTTARQGVAEQGRYLASVACTECHAPSLRGFPGDIAPSLVVAKAYSPQAFARLMREGITLAGTPSRTGLMSSVARGRFAHFREDEVAALKAYLDERAP